MVFAELVHGLLRRVAMLQLPCVVLFEQNGSHEAGDRSFVGKDALSPSVSRATTIDDARNMARVDGADPCPVPIATGSPVAAKDRLRSGLLN